MNRLMTFILGTYCIIVHFGNAFRFSRSEVALGVSTILGMILAASAILQFPKQVSKVPIYLVFAVLFGWVALTSVTSPFGVLIAYQLLAALVIYLAMSTSISTWKFDKTRLAFVTFSISLGLLLASGLTIIDFMKWASIPYCNTLHRATRLQDLGGTEYIAQAAGFFLNRSAMAALFSISISMSVMLAFTMRNWIAKAFYAVSATSGLLCMITTHNRSCILSVGFGYVVYILLNKGFSLTRRIKLLSFACLFGFVLLFVALEYFPQHMTALENKLAAFFGGGQRATVESDRLRIVYLQTAVSSVVTNPIGHGFGRVELQSGWFKGSHNMLTSFIWAAGVFAFLWFVPFFIISFRTIFRAPDVESSVKPFYDAARLSLVVWFIHNMAHETIATGLAWLLLGIIIGLQRQASSLQEAEYLQPAMQYE